MMSKDHDLDYRPGKTDPARLRFVADCMLGKLAKWLRILGYDTLYDPHLDDDQILQHSLDDGRIILTRDTRLVQRRLARRHLLVESSVPAEQLRQVIETFRLPVDERLILSRCLPCNRPIDSVERADVESLVPPYVFRTQKTFARCSGCGRVYWGATHIADIRRRIERLLRGRAGGRSHP
jgi:uncharacterized protein with PIN domain